MKYLHRLKYKINRILRIPKCVYLCIRFPFLYPRNRFTDKHQVSPNWLVKLSNKYYKKAYTKINLSYKFYKDPKECTEFNSIIRDVGKYNFNVNLTPSGILKFESTYIDSPLEFNLQKHVGKDFTITGITTSTNIFTNDPYIIYHVHKNKITKYNYGFACKTLKICVDKFYKKVYNSIIFIWDNIINRICFIPTSTELDAMPTGWRKAFGIQMCKDLKKVLKKHNYLYKYRIIQIKEKFGMLAWYSNGSPNGCEYPIINTYEELSERTCICCGAKAKYITRGWISPYCKKCVPKNVVSDEIKY